VLLHLLLACAFTGLRYGFVSGDRDGGMSGISTKHVVLGLLVERPSYGYELAQRLGTRLDFLGLQGNSIYRILDRLEDDGWIVEIGERRVRRTRRGAAADRRRP